MLVRKPDWNSLSNLRDPQQLAADNPLPLELDDRHPVRPEEPVVLRHGPHGEPDDRLEDSEMDRGRKRQVCSISYFPDILSFHRIIRSTAFREHYC